MTLNTVATLVRRKDKTLNASLNDFDKAIGKFHDNTLVSQFSTAEMGGRERLVLGLSGPGRHRQNGINERLTEL